uniref:protein-glutamine gamma-glutamyltransferase n=2 Tax=Gouania willdenowi TaxID=441366 RepID=A0A8C5HWD1_GOUWI
MLGRLYVTLPVSFSKNTSSSARWKAYCEPKDFNPQNPSIFISPPASASVGCYKFYLYVALKNGKWNCVSGNFILLCNPWCSEDAVHIPFEDQREEYVQSDSGLLFMGTATNPISRPWSFDQYEPGVLETCLNLLQVSPLHKKNKRRDYLKRNNPVYISRVVSAMINCEDDCGVLKGNWSKNFKEGVNPSTWTGSGDILKQWAQSAYKPVKYGQCWVFAAVMCTVMRVLGIPCRVVTNFDSAHDTNDNLVIEEYYSETGQKLNHTKDSIWNFHVWVECWMDRRDLGSEMNGWQVLDPTPQHRSKGVYCCGPAPVKAIKKQHIDLVYDIPFVYAEVNADVYAMIVSKGKVLRVHKDTERVGSLICTKAVGFPRPQNITAEYKYVKSHSPALSSRSSTPSDISTLSRDSSSGMSVFLTLDESPVAGAPIRFMVQVINKHRVAKMLKVHLNAQAKEYNHSPSDTFWEEHGVIQLAPSEVKVMKQQIFPAQYEDVVGDDMINLAVVLEDMANEERVLASEEFNIACTELSIEIPDESSVEINKDQTATISFTNPFTQPTSGVLTVTGAGLMRSKMHYRMPTLSPGGVVEQRVTFRPYMVGSRMLQATLSFTNINTTIRGFKMISVES